VLAHGFARVRCESCKDELLVAFSCKGRGVCPSCNAKRAQVTATHLKDAGLLQRRLRWTEVDVRPPPRKQPRCALKVWSAERLPRKREVERLYREPALAWLFVALSFVHWDKPRLSSLSRASLKEDGNAVEWGSGLEQSGGY
jgi:hypothetical protein